VQKDLAALTSDYFPTMASSETTGVQTRPRWVPSLPDEMVELILIRVPSSSLLRCRSVCRQWRLILRDPRFAAAHLELQRAPACCPLLFSNRESALKKLYPSEAILFDEAWSPSRWDAPVIEPDDFLFACCNGLACLYSDRSTIKIANLATGECLHLAKPDNRATGDHYFFYNFGFHPVTKEYKVIRFLGERALFSVGTVIVVQVYTLGDDKWRDVRAPKTQTLNCIDYSGVVNVDGAMYWLSEDERNRRRRAIVSFDLREERFEWIQLPIADDHAGPRAYSTSRMYWVTEVDAKVCVATAENSFHSAIEFVGNLQIWTLENKADQSWRHKCTIQFSSAETCIPRPHFIHGDKIIFYGKGGNIYYQELIGQNIKIKQSKMVRLFNYSPRWCGNMQSFKYARSLVQLDAYSRGGVCFQRPKRREGWKLKKWENWMLELCALEKLWRRVYELERSISVK